jgi:hypothetical protein
MILEMQMIRFDSIPRIIQTRMFELFRIFQNVLILILELTMESTPEANYFGVHLESKVFPNNLL